MRELTYKEAQALYIKKLKRRAESLPESPSSEAIVVDVDFLMAYYAYQETPDIRKAIKVAQRLRYTEEMIDALKQFYSLASSMDITVLSEAVIDAIHTTTDVLEHGNKLLGDKD